MRQKSTTAKTISLAVFIGLFISLAIFLNLTSVSISARSDGASPGYTGAPGEADCTDCHDQTAGSGQFNLVLPQRYIPGKTYSIEARHTTADMTRLRWGFQLTALRSNDSAAGTFVNTTANTQIEADAGRNYVNHTSAGSFQGQSGGATWQFNWTAPVSNVGSVTFYSAGLQANNGNGNSNDRTYTVSQMIAPAAPPPAHQFIDFDGDGKADPAVFRPSNGTWYAKQSTSGFMAVPFGIGTDNMTPADFDGDGKTDIAVWRETGPAGSTFYILESQSGTVRTDVFGQAGDDPSVIGDWDGDGRADVAVYRDSAVGPQSYFYYRGSSNNPSGNITFLPWGTTGDRPLRGDFDGDARQDLAVFRPSNGVWYILESGSANLRFERWGLATDQFVQADYDADGKTDPAVFRAGVWYIRRSSDSQIQYETWGLDTDVLVPADYDGDAMTDVAVYRDGTWFVKESNTGSLVVHFFGFGTDKAVQASIGK